MAINRLVSFETYVHRHLGWRAPADWLGHRPFWVIEQDETIKAALACPPDPADVAWLRLFATQGDYSPERAWPNLWQRALAELQGSPTEVVVALALFKWTRKILREAGFVQKGDVVMLRWEGPTSRLPEPIFRGIIRPLTDRDLPAVQAVDNAAFEQIWRHSERALQIGLSKSNWATIAEDERGLLGYQMSTPSITGGHLARLAVRPDLQGSGVGYALVHDLIHRFRSRSALEITVNTQSYNASSLALYKKAHFVLTGEAFPVYHYDLEKEIAKDDRQKQES
jgi:ribosomal protein S18 acetylase RimI-like enzyme